jgi:predicted transcriptional regulator
MRRTRIAALTAAGAIAAAGTGVAVATTTSDDPKEREDAVLADAAERLDVEPYELRDALADAEDAQLDADVKAGNLTQEQADAIKERRRESGMVLGGPKPFGGGPDIAFGFAHAGGGPIGLFDAAADALGISRDELRDRLRDGKTLEEIAKAEGKSLDDVRQAVEAELKERFDKAVAEGDLTRRQADRMLAGASDMLDDLGKVLRGPKLLRDGPDFGLHFKHPGGGPIELFDAAADALGISRDALEERLRDGKTLEEIAKAEGKSVDDVREAVESELKERFDKAVEDGDLTREQADRMLSHVTELLDDLGDFPRLRPPAPPWP